MTADLADHDDECLPEVCTEGLPMVQEPDYDAALRDEFQTTMRTWASKPEHAGRTVTDIYSYDVADMVVLLKQERIQNTELSEVVTFQHSIDMTPYKWQKAIFPWGFFNETREDVPPPPPPSYKATQVSASLMIDEYDAELINAIDAKLLTMSSLDGEGILSAKEDGDKFLMDAHMVFTGSSQTYMSIATDDGQITGCGWNVIEPFMFPFKNLRSSKCKICISPCRIWSQDKKKGVTWQVDCIVLIPGPEREEEWEDPLLFTD